MTARDAARLGRTLGAIVIAFLLVGVGWWAGRATLTSPTTTRNPASQQVVVTVTQATVGRSLSLSVTVEQPFSPVAVNALAGTVTSVKNTDRVVVGDVLYTVDTVPVRAVAGDLPFYRAMAGGEVGTDVSQLQRALRSMRLYSGVVTGRFDGWTAEAVRAWQRRLKLPATGVVGFGEVVAVPKLPSALLLSEDIVKGTRVSGGEPAVSAPTGKVDFSLVVGRTQAALIPPGTRVDVVHGSRTWPAVLGSGSVGAEDSVKFTLAAPGGGRVCAQSCSTLPARQRTSLVGKVIIVPEVTGSAVPVAAIHTGATGEAYVLLADGGTRRNVTVRGSTGGVAVVDGLRVGERVLAASVPSAARVDR